MSKRKDFPLVDNSNENLNRRKMKAIRQCLKILEEDFTEPHQRKCDLCHISKTTSVEAFYDNVEDEDTDLFGFSPTETKTDFKRGLCSGNLQRLARPFCHSTEEKNVQHPISSNGGLKDKPAIAPSADMHDGTATVPVCNIYEMFTKRTSLGDTKCVTLTGNVSPGTGSGGNVYEVKTGTSPKSSS